MKLHRMMKGYRKLKRAHHPWRWVVVCACIAISSGQAQEIRVLTYNIEATVGAGATLDTPQSRAVARVVEFNKLDLLLINELRANGSLWDAIRALQNWVNAFIPHFGGVAGSTYYTHVSTQTDGTLRNAVVSRFPIHTPTTFDDGQRGLLSLQVELPNGRRLQVFLAHLSCCTACATRQTQAKAMANIISAWAATNSAPYLVAGDWNEDEERPICALTDSYRPIATIRSAGLSENRLADLDGSRFSWTTRDPAPFLPMRFDYLLPAAARLKCTGGYVFNSSAWHALGLLPAGANIRYDDCRTGSDHYPLLGRFSLGPDPQPPQQLVARALSTNRVELVWAAGGVDHSGYRIERSLRFDTGFVPLAVVGAAATNFVDNTTRPAVTYYYRVVATNDSGASDSCAIGVATPAAQLPLYAAFHSPSVSTNNPWPNADDGTEVFDFEISGGVLPLANGALPGGFGSLTRTVFNHDGDYLYVGVEGLNRAGDNVCLVLLDTRPGGMLSLAERGRPFGIGVARNITFAPGFQPDVAVLLGGEFGDAPNFTNYFVGSRDFGQGVYALGIDGTTHFPGFSTVFGSSPISQFGATNNLNAEIKLSREALGLRDGRNSFKAAALFLGGDNDGRRYVSGRVYGERVEGAKDGLNFGFNVVRITGSTVALAAPDPATAILHGITSVPDGVALEWIAQSNRVYTVQLTDAPLSVTSVWTSVLTTNNVDGAIVWTDTGTADIPPPPTTQQRFYRILVSE